MLSPELLDRIEALVRGDISPADHGLLQDELKSDAEARAALRERIDVEASLRTWANEEVAGDGLPFPTLPRDTAWYVPLGIAAAILLIMLPNTYRWLFSSPQASTVVPVTPVRYLGSITRQQDCVWNHVAALTSGHRFASERLSLRSGVAELVFDSGTTLLLNGPCELTSVAHDTAELHLGEVVVVVGELSDGFTLDTPDATIIDEGTEYAVSLGQEGTEVHVFDGSVIWAPDSDHEERIEAGQARRYERSKRGRGARIPLDERRFVRQLEAQVQVDAEGALLAYDGFENLAGRMRRGRSGFGWSDGWRSAGRRRGPVAEITDAPADRPFGFERDGRRMLQLSNSEFIQRELSDPVSLLPGAGVYMSALIHQEPGATSRGRHLRLDLVDVSDSVVGLGVASDGLPALHIGGTLKQVAVEIADGEVCLTILRLQATQEGVEGFLRVYGPGETVDPREPATWTITAVSDANIDRITHVRLKAGQESAWYIDELRIGTTWRSVVSDYIAD